MERLVRAEWGESGRYDFVAKAYMMNEGYSPKSDFLCMVANGEITLTGSQLADHNLRLLITFTRDPELSNRDWATMLLAQLDIDTPETREALLMAAHDADAVVRGEALVGLARRDTDLALPLIKAELEGNDWGSPTFEAAEILAHPSLLDGLRRWAGTADKSWTNDEIAAAIAACEGKARPRR